MRYQLRADPPKLSPALERQGVWILVRQGDQTVQCANATGRERSVSLTCVQCARTARISGNEPSPARKRHFASAYDAKAKVMNIFFYIHSYSRKI